MSFHSKNILKTQPEFLSAPHISLKHFSKRKKKTLLRKTVVITNCFKNSLGSLSFCGYKPICAHSPHSSLCLGRLRLSWRVKSPVTKAGSTPCRGLSPPLTHVGEITLRVFRLQVVQNTIPGFGKQVQLLEERCLLPIHGVGTDDAGSEFTTIAQL